MKSNISGLTVFALIALMVSVEARGVHPTTYSLMRLARRRVPQEHAWDATITVAFRKCVEQPVLKENGFKGTPDVIFGLLGDAAATPASKTTPECLQQDTADLAITLAKKSGSKECIRLAMAYRTLERNTGQAGLASKNCTTKPVNNELSTLSQHQDTSGKQQSLNKDVELKLASALAATGMNPDDILVLVKNTASFAPGNPSDPTAKGGSCDPGQVDPIGCEKGKLIPAASDQEILDAAKKGSSGNNNDGTNGNTGNKDKDCNGGNNGNSSNDNKNKVNDGTNGNSSNDNKKVNDGTNDKTGSKDKDCNDGNNDNSSNDNKNKDNNGTNDQTGNKDKDCNDGK